MKTEVGSLALLQDEKLGWEIPLFTDKVGLEQFIKGLPSRSVQIKSALKAFQKARLDQRQERLDQCRQHACMLQSAEKAGIAVCHLDNFKGARELPCSRCSQLFNSPAALAAHLSKKHGVKSELAAIVGGTVCQSCLKDHRSSARLLKHLYNVPLCKNRYLAADIRDGGPQIKGTSFACSPPVKVFGPAPFWSHLTPLPHEAARSSRIGLEVTIRAFAHSDLLQLEGRKLSKAACSFWALIESSKADSSEICEALENLSISTPALSLLNDLGDTYAAMKLQPEGGCRTLTCLKARWKHGRCLLAREGEFTNDMIHWIESV